MRDRHPGLTAAAWMALAILCAFILGYADLRGVSAYVGLSERVGGWLLLGKLLLLVCLLHVAIYTARIAQPAILWAKEATVRIISSWCSKDSLPQIPGADLKKLRDMARRTRRD